MATATKTVNRSGVVPLAAAGILALLFVAAWALQLVEGMSALGIGQTVVWGVYIAAFFLLLGAGCGSVMLAAAGDLGIVPAFQPYRRPLLIAALALFVAGGLTILVDIGRPDRVLNLLFSLQIKSPFVWDFFGLSLALIATAAYLYLGPKGKILPLLAGFGAAAVVIVEGWILGGMAARPLWHGGLLPVLFAIEGFISAMAVGIFLTEFRSVAQGLLRKGLIVLLAVLGLVQFLEVIAFSYTGETAAKSATAQLISGSLAPYFWSQMVLGIVVPLVLLAWFGQSKLVLQAAAVLALLGVLVAKLDTLVAGQAQSLFGSPAVYTPTGIEVMGVIGVMALAVLLYLLGRRLLPSQA